MSLALWARISQLSSKYAENIMIFNNYLINYANMAYIYYYVTVFVILIVHLYALLKSRKRRTRIGHTWPTRNYWRR
jgi:hypothetical protein